MKVGIFSFFKHEAHLGEISSKVSCCSDGGSGCGGGGDKCCRSCGFRVRRDCS
jgi:hypothetical protein